MSDLFNQGEFEKSFDANQFLRSLCKDTKIKVPIQVPIRFLPGWKVVVEKLVETIKNYPICILHFNDSYSMLDIDFSVIKQTREVNVWRAINDARKESQHTCAMCGDFKRHFLNGNSASMFCRNCIKNQAVVAKTGTWLDTY